MIRRIHPIKRDRLHVLSVKHANDSIEPLWRDLHNSARASYTVLMDSVSMREGVFMRVRIIAEQIRLDMGVVSHMGLTRETD